MVAAPLEGASVAELGSDMTVGFMKKVKGTCDLLLRDL
jgi:hypothetical protein